MSETVTKEPEFGVKGPRKILMKDLKRAEISRPDYRVLIKDINITVEDVIAPEYWTNVAEIFMKDQWPFAIIEVIWADASKYMRLLVTNTQRISAKVVILELVNLNGNVFVKTPIAKSVASKSEAAIKSEVEDKKSSDTVEEAKPVNEDYSDIGNYDIKYKGPVKKFCVIRKSDNRDLESEVATKEEAKTWLDDYIKAMK